MLSMLSKSAGFIRLLLFMSVLISVFVVGCVNKSIEQAKLATAALKKVQSRISVGINYYDYGVLVGETKFIIDEGYRKSGLSESNPLWMYIKSAQQDFESANVTWDAKIKLNRVDDDHPVCNYFDKNLASKLIAPSNKGEYDADISKTIFIDETGEACNYVPCPSGNFLSCAGDQLFLEDINKSNRKQVEVCFCTDYGQQLLLYWQHARNMVEKADQLIGKR